MNNKFCVQGRAHSKEVIDKIRKSNKNRWVGDGGDVKKRKKKVSCEIKRWHETASEADLQKWKNNISCALKGSRVNHSKDTCNKISEQIKNWHNNMPIDVKNKLYKKVSESNSKKVVHIDSGIIFDSITKAGDFYGLTRQAVSYHCRGKSNKQKFKFLEV